MRRSGHNYWRWVTTWPITHVIARQARPKPTAAVAMVLVVPQTKSACIYDDLRA
jgi:hypothetical protein